MPRSRELKYGFFTDEEIARLTPWARLLFEGLWCLADRDGRLEDRPARIHALVFPYDHQLDIDALLREIAEAKGDFIQRYEVDGKNYIQIRTLNKNQHFHPKEKSAGYPTPPARKVPGLPGNSTSNPALPSLSSLPSQSSMPSVDCSEVADEPPEPSLLTFPCAKKETWALTESVRAELAEAYPASDVMACARQALEWCRSNPKRVKTAGRMRGWLGSVWCAKEQDRPHLPQRADDRRDLPPPVQYPRLIP
jgi:hypothetical protein